MVRDKVFDIKERTYTFSLRVIGLAGKLDRSLTNQILSKQLIRSGTSIGANIAEGYAGSSKKDFINYYNISLKSANETIYWLKLLGEVNPKILIEIEENIKEAEEIACILAKIVINCRK